MFLIVGFCLTQRILNAQCVHLNACGKKRKPDSGGTRTHNLLLSHADILTTRAANMLGLAGWYESDVLASATNNYF